MSISCFPSIHLPPAFFYIHAHQAHFLSLESSEHDIGVPCAWSTLALSSSALPSGAAAVLCRLELGWGELASGPVQLLRHRHTQALSAGFLCLVSLSSGLAGYMRPTAEDESQPHVFAVIKQFYLVMLKSFTWILQLYHDGAENSASQLTAASVGVISAVCYAD